MKSGKVVEEVDVVVFCRWGICSGIVFGVGIGIGVIIVIGVGGNVMLLNFGNWRRFSKGGWIFMVRIFIVIFSWCSLVFCWYRRW